MLSMTSPLIRRPARQIPIRHIGRTGNFQMNDGRNEDSRIRCLRHAIGPDPGALHLRVSIYGRLWREHPKKKPENVERHIRRTERSDMKRQ